MRYLLVGVCLLLSGCIVPVTPMGQVTVPMAIPVLIDTAESSHSNAVYVCSLKPFSREYRSEHAHRGIAKLNAQKQCLANHQAMFCEEKEISCQIYD